jgi:hypothetical protein
MRQLYPRASRLRFFVLVAALSVITLSASSPIYSAATGVRFTGHTFKSPAAAAAGTAATPDCSKAAGLEVVQRLHLNDTEVTDPVYKVLCGSFTGPGSQTMVVSLMGPGSSGMLDWVVFRWAGNAWELLMKRHQSAVLTAAGSDIRETVSIFRAGDSRCCPSGGTKARLWHWNGTRLVAGAWKQVTPPKSSTGAILHLYVFASPSRNILCRLGDEDLATCLTVKPPRSVHMSRNGHLSLCRGTRCIGTGRFGGVPTLGYGENNAYAGYLCRSQRVGVTCTDTKSGKGFLINSASVRRVGP